MNDSEVSSINEFVAIDVETANSDMASICQIGIAKFSNGKLVDEWSSLIDPEDYFDSINIGIHGIDEDCVSGKPTFPEIVETLKKFLENTLCVCHTHFDRVSINKALRKYDVIPLSSVWLDSAMVVRRTWSDVANQGYGLANVCKKLGYTFKHHDALEDAKASGYVLLAAINESNMDLDAWKKRITQPIDPANSSSGAAIRREGNPEGELRGEEIVFTGALEMSRNEAANLAARLGCKVTDGVTKKTTLLVVGDQDVTKLAGKEKSAKHLKAEMLIAKGHKIRILKESDFMELSKLSQTS